MNFAFQFATKFQGTGIDQWITSAVKTFIGTFWGASVMNNDLGSWDVRRCNDEQDRGEKTDPAQRETEREREREMDTVEERVVYNRK